MICVTIPRKTNGSFVLDDEGRYNATVGCARTNVIGSRTSFVIAFLRSSMY